MHARALATFAAALAATILVRAQTPETPVFKAEANLVVLHVNVFDKRFEPVDDLKSENFLVIEDDRPQTLSFFSSEDVPVTVGLVVDNSSSMLTRRKMVVAGGMAFANSSHPEDELFLVSFTENVRLGLPPGMRFTSARRMLEASLNMLKPGGQTAFYDAVIRALDHVAQATHQKRVLIVLSDGDDTASVNSRKDMYERARQSDAIIYTIGLSSPGERGDPGVMKELAKIGGGVAYRPDTEDDVIHAFEVVARNIRTGYSLGYVPAVDLHDGAYRRVKIMVRVPGRSSFEVRYRHGYSAPTVQ